MGRRGIASFYPNLSWEQASNAYLEAVARWRAGSEPDPLAALNKLLPSSPPCLKGVLDHLAGSVR